LEHTRQQLTEVVVTALGIKKERKSLGYSVTEIKGEELTKAREVNMLNSLEGKVAGLNVSAISGGPGASSNVLIRGVSSLGQTNQPLYVINGVPIENQPSGTTNNGTGDMGTQYDNAPDLGDAMGNINPDDIETISVLKGAAASALYGYRAKGGVILITTKSAKSNSIPMPSVKRSSTPPIGNMFMDREPITSNPRIRLRLSNRGSQAMEPSSTDPMLSSSMACLVHMWHKKRTWRISIVRARPSPIRSLLIKSLREALSGFPPMT